MAERPDSWCGAMAVDEMWHAGARRAMVRGQLEPDGAGSPPLLRAAAVIGREFFLPPAVRDFACADRAFRFGDGRLSLAPRRLFRMIGALGPGPGEKLLAIGGSGYGGAIAACLGARVIQLAGRGLAGEMGDALAAALAPAGAGRDIVVREAPFLDGAPDEAPVDAILVEGSVAAIPPAWLAQLGRDGRICLIREESSHVARAILCDRRGMVTDVLFDTAPCPLPGAGVTALHE